MNINLRQDAPDQTDKVDVNELSEAIEQFKSVGAQILAAEIKLKELKEQEKYISEHVIPDIMEKQNLKTLKRKHLFFQRKSHIIRNTQEHVVVSFCVTRSHIDFGRGVQARLEQHLSTFQPTAVPVHQLRRLLAPETLSYQPSSLEDSLCWVLNHDMTFWGCRGVATRLCRNVVRFPGWGHFWRTCSEKLQDGHQSTQKGQ